MSIAKKKTIRVVLIEPGREAREADIGYDLHSMQETVGGKAIETCYPFPGELVTVVCDDEGKLNGSLPNRLLFGEDGEPIDIIYGTFFICGIESDHFSSLSEEQTARYIKQFQYPEFFRKEGNEIIVTRVSRIGQAD